MLWNVLPSIISCHKIYIHMWNIKEGYLEYIHGDKNGWLHIKLLYPIVASRSKPHRVFS